MNTTTAVRPDPSAAPTSTPSSPLLPVRVAFPHNGPYESLPAAGASELRFEILQEFVAQYGGNTKAAYTIDLADWFGYCQYTLGIDPLAATRVHVRGYVDDLLARGRRPATFARRASTLRGFYRFAATEYSVGSGTAADIRIRAPRSSDRPPALTLQQLSAFLAAADEHSPRSAGLAWLLAGHGLRISEGCNLRHEDVLIGDDVTRVRIVAKGGATRTIPLAGAVFDRIQPLLHPGRPVFATRTGLAWDRNSAARTLRTVAAGAGIAERFSPHVLRHTFVTLALQLGAPLHVVQDAAGHADPATTRRYDHPDPNALAVPSLMLTAALAGERPLRDAMTIGDSP